jgi:hypothetical protein
VWRLGDLSLQVVPGDTTGLIQLASPPSGGARGLHALIIGVGNYPNLVRAPNNLLGMGHLDGPARTALKFAEFLLSFDTKPDRLAAPLRSLRLLLSPSPREQGQIPIPAGISPANWQTIHTAAVAWRHAATNSADDVTLFYFAGHGIQRGPAEGVLFPEDVLEGYPDDGAPILDRAFDVNNLYNGMAPKPGELGSAPETIANIQYFFFDACRSPLPALNNFFNASPRPLFNVRADGVDNRIAPRFFAANPGGLGYATPIGTTFGEDLLKCLSGAGADLLSSDGSPVWGITIDRLSRVMESMRDEWNATYPAYRRSFELGNITSTKPILVQFASPPAVACRFTIQPDTALAEASLKLVTYRAGQEIMAHCEGPPLPSACVAREFPGGTYLIQASHSSGPPQFQQLAVILPPSFVQKVIFG